MQEGSLCSCPDLGRKVQSICGRGVDHLPSLARRPAPRTVALGKSPQTLTRGGGRLTRRLRPSWTPGPGAVSHAPSAATDAWVQSGSCGHQTRAGLRAARQVCAPWSAAHRGTFCPDGWGSAPEPPLARQSPSESARPWSPGGSGWNLNSGVIRCLLTLGSFVL